MQLEAQDATFVQHLHDRYSKIKYDVAAYLVRRKAEVEHGYFGELKRAVATVLDISTSTVERYMRVVQVLPEHDYASSTLTALYALTRAPDAVKGLVRDAGGVSSPDVVQFLEAAYNARAVDSTWAELQQTGHLQWDDEAVPLQEVTPRDVRAFVRAQEWGNKPPQAFVRARVELDAGDKLVLKIINRDGGAIWQPGDNLDLSVVVLA